MSLFAYTRTRRRTAIVMLGAWMLALLVGIANACASGRPDSSHASGERQATMAGHDHDAGASTGSEQARGADGSRPLKPACQKFCDEEATTVVKHDRGSGLVLAVVRGLAPASPPGRRASSGDAAHHAIHALDHLDPGPVVRAPTRASASP